MLSRKSIVPRTFDFGGYEELPRLSLRIFSGNFYSSIPFATNFICGKRSCHVFVPSTLYCMCFQREVSS